MGNFCNVAHFTLYLLRFHESYFSRKHIFHQSYRVNKTQDMVLKPANKYQIIRQCHNFKNNLIYDCQHDLFLYQAKVL